MAWWHRCPGHRNHWMTVAVAERPPNHYHESFVGTRSHGTFRRSGTQGCNTPTFVSARGWRLHARTLAGVFGCIWQLEPMFRDPVGARRSGTAPAHDCGKLRQRRGTGGLVGAAPLTCGTSLKLKGSNEFGFSWADEFLVPPSSCSFLGRRPRLPRRRQFQ